MLTMPHPWQGRNNMYTRTMMFNDLHAGHDSFTIHNKLYLQLVTPRMIEFLEGNYSKLLDECRASSNPYFNDVRISAKWDNIAACLWRLVDHKTLREIEVCASFCSKVCVLKVACRKAIGRLPEGCE